MATNIKKYFNRYFENLVILFFALTILPFLILSIFINPTYDDFFYSEVANEMGLWNSVYYWYDSMTGRYFSMALLSSVNPLIFKSIIGYKMLPAAFIFITVIATYLLISEISSNIISKKEILISSLAFSFLYFYRMPSLPEYYWLTTAIIYELANILMLILFILILRFFKEKNSIKKSTLRFCIIILILAVIGLNEASMIILIELLLSISILNLLVYKRVNRQFFLFAFIAILGFCIVYFAPGTYKRLAAAPGIPQQLIPSLVNTASDLLRFILNRILDTPILLFTILFIPVCAKIISSKKIDNSFFSINPAYSILLFLILLASGFFTSYWSLGLPPYERVMNVIYFLFLAGWFINILIIINFFKNKFDFRFYSLQKYALVIIFVAIAFSVFKNNNNIKIAYAELFYGDAYKYDEKQKERYRNINQSISDTCTVDSIGRVPTPFLFHEISSGKQSNYNKYYARYFNKKVIVVKKPNLDSIK
ncbi:MAG: DUF6056 family protein [Bacteroidota bacterium]|nr:DUF6056 family protein [Bacteroidota bacterium]